MRESIILFTFGPVGELIQASRTMRDLYAGSYLLSYLTNKLMEKLDEEGMELIFPDKQMESLPNRVVFFSNDSVEEFQPKGEKLERFVQRTWEELAIETFKQEKIPLTCKAQAQIRNYLSIQWLALPFKGNYHQSYNEIIQTMHHLKRTRTFQQLPLIAGRRCDLLPALQAIYVRPIDKFKLPAFVNECIVIEKNIQEKNIQKGNDLKEGECLSAVALFKRLLYKNKNLKNGNFPYKNSLPSVANMIIQNEIFKRKIEGFTLEDYPAIYSDGSEIFYDYWEGHAIKKIYRKEVIEEFNLIKQKYPTLIKHEATAYYALIKLDGDGVGSEYQNSKKLEDHRKLSEKIGRFSREAKKIIEAENGLCLYAGGEDVLAFAPIEKVFTLLAQIRSNFQQMVTDDKGSPFTLSGGIIFAHLMSPLAPLLQRVEELEAYGKDMEGKNAFAMEVQYRGGKYALFRDKFDKFTEFQTLFNQLHAKGSNPSIVEGLMETLHGLDGGEDKNKENKIGEKIIPILIKRKVDSLSVEMSKEQKNKLAKDIVKLYENQEDTKRGNLSQFIQKLKVMSFLKKEGVTSIG